MSKDAKYIIGNSAKDGLDGKSKNLPGGSMESKQGGCNSL